MKITLKVKNGNTVEAVQHEVEELNILQVTKALKVIKDIFKMADEDAGLKGLLSEMMTGVQEGISEDDEAITGLIKAALGAADVLLMEIPEQALKLLSILSGVELDTLMQQSTHDVFDIYDAVIEVNDIEKLVNRAKKSLAVTKSRITLKNLLNKA